MLFLRRIFYALSLFYCVTSESSEVWILINSNRDGVSIRCIKPTGEIIAQKKVGGNGNIYENPSAHILVLQALQSCNDQLVNCQISQFAICATGVEVQSALESYRENVISFLVEKGICVTPIITQQFIAMSLGAHEGNTGITALSSTGSFAGLVSSQGEILYRVIPSDEGLQGFGLTAFGQLLSNYLFSFCRTHSEHNKILSCQSCRQESDLTEKYSSEDLTSVAMSSLGCEVKRSQLACNNDRAVNHVLDVAVANLIYLLEQLQHLSRQLWPSNLCLIGCASEAIRMHLDLGMLFKKLNLTLLPQVSSNACFDGLYFIIKRNNS